MKIKNFDTDAAYLQFEITPNGISVEYRANINPDVSDYELLEAVHFSWLEIATLHNLDIESQREMAFNMAAAAHMMCVHADFTEATNEEEESDDE